MTNGDELETKPPSKLPMILGIGCVVLILLAGGCGIACYFLMDAGMQQQVATYPSQLQDPDLFESPEKKDQVIAKFESLQDLKVNLWAVGAIEPALQAYKSDGEVSNDEADHLLEILDAIIAAGGKLEMTDVQKYTPR